MEFKIEPDGSFAVKQIRPFLHSTEKIPTPEFTLEIPPQTEVCGTFIGRGDLGVGISPLEWYQLKSTIRFVDGPVQLPTKSDNFTASLFEEVRLGPEQAVAVTAGPGTFHITRRDDNNDDEEDQEEEEEEKEESKVPSLSIKSRFNSEPTLKKRVICHKEERQEAKKRRIK